MQDPGYQLNLSNIDDDDDESGMRTMLQKLSKCEVKA